jgi:hypothetical protein
LVGTIGLVSRWLDWHDAYDAPESPLSRRLAIVRGCISDALDAAPPGPVRVVSLCAGDGRDILGVLERHRRARDVSGRLVELDPDLAARAAARAPGGIDVQCGDASSTAAFEGAVPADLVLVCGVFGNIGEGDIVGTIRTLPSLCAAGATIVWTRHRRPPDRTVLVRETFAAAGFAEVAFVAPDGFLFGVGVHRLTADPEPFDADRAIFTFLGYDNLVEPCAECGFVYDLDRTEIVRRLEADATAFVARFGELDRSAARRRPAPEVWSPLEYACHLRDVLGVQHDRVELMQRESTPSLRPMGRDERVVADRYNEQDPDVVGTELQAAAATLADRLAHFDDEAWLRTARYNYPTEQVRTVEWIGTHTVHELQHHRHDIARVGGAALGQTGSSGR